MRRRLRWLAALAGAGMLLSGLGATSQASTSGPSTATTCSTAWGTGSKSGGSLSTAPLVTTRVGQHDCYDRLVFEFNGTAKGYRVQYASHVYTQGEGADLVPYTAGRAFLDVALLEPTYDLSGTVTYRHAAGDHVANVFKFRTLRDVVYGGSFEGYTTFAVGVRAISPFRVFTLAGPGTHSRIVLDVAHQ